MSDEGSFVFVGAVQWIVQAMTGPAAVVLAIIAVALIGFRFMQGRIEGTRALRVSLGCFIVFGAPTIAQGILRDEQAIKSYSPQLSYEQALPLPVPSNEQVPYDPYAGASVPAR